MAEEYPSTTTTTNVNNDETSVDETKDRGLFNFLGKKEEEKPCKEEVIAPELEKVHVSEHEPKTEEKKPSLLQKFRGSDSASSSSSSDEEVEEGGEKKKKKKEKKKKEEGTTIPVQEKHGFVEKIKEKIVPGQTNKTEELVPPPEEKKGFFENIKEKLPKKTEDHVPPRAELTPIEAHTPEGEPKEKKGIMDKIKEKIPGYQSKSEEEKEKEKY